MTQPENLLNFSQLKRAAAQWYLKNCNSAFLPLGGNEEDFIAGFSMPEPEFSPLESYVDTSGDYITVLQAKLVLTAACSRSGKPEVLEIFKIIKSYPDTPDIRPVEAGYSIKNLSSKQ